MRGTKPVESLNRPLMTLAMPHRRQSAMTVHASRRLRLHGGAWLARYNRGNH